MAKGNLLLGTAGNSVGDVVMYRREGAQVSRVRVRKIKNPKTDAQSLQRAAFSPVAKFYSPLAVVLERSFEGLSKMKSYNKFLKTNIDLARANGWLLPKGTGFFPLPYKLSQGTIQKVSYGYDANGGLGFYFSNLQVPQSTPQISGPLSDMFINAGWKAGDIVTIIAIGHDDIESGDVTLFNYTAKTVQFELNSDGTESVTELFGNQLKFQIEDGSALLQGNDGFELMAMACIVARFENNVWRRSTQNLLVNPSIITAITASAYHEAAIASYGPNAGDANPLVYLDGDTLEG